MFNQSAITRWAHLGLATLAVLCLFAGAAAQDPGTTDPGFVLHDPLHGSPHHPDLTVDGRWIPVDELAGADHPGWATFREHMGPGWRAGFNAATGAPIWCYGPGVDTGEALHGDVRTVEVARTWLERLAGPLGVKRITDLRLDRVSVTRNPEGNTVVGVDFAEHYQGYPVDYPNGHRTVRFRFHGESGKLFVVGSDVTPDLAVDVRDPLDRGVTFQACLDRLEELHSFGPLDRYARYVLIQDGQARLVDQHDFVTEQPPHRWVFIHDARTGALVEYRDDLRHDSLTGTVSAGVLLNGGGSYGSFQVMPLRDVEVNIATVGQTYTDAQGNFQVVVPDKNPRTVSGRLYGRHADVQTYVGSALAFSQPATAGTPAQIVMNPSNSQYTTAQTTAYYHVTEGNNFVRQYYGTLSYYLNAFPVYTNYPNYCNAFFSGSGIYFLRAGSSCNNTAFAEIILHEWGHAFHTSFHGSTNPADFSEGIADQIALYWTGQRIMGRGFTTTGAVVRDYRHPSGSSCCSIYPVNHPDSHKRGEPWAGGCMDLRDNLINTHGQTQGANVAAQVTIAMYSRNPADMTRAAFEVFVQDDNDANLLNGTPNFMDLAKALDAHGFKNYRPADPVLVDLAITHTPPTDPNVDVVNNLAIVARVTGQNGRTVKKVELLLGTTTAPMILVGQDIYRVEIAPADPLKVVSYSIQATSDQNFTLTAGPYHVRTGRVSQVILHEDFENGWNGWTHGMVQTEDDWMLGPPNQSRVNPHDPPRAYHGTNLVGNDLAPTGHDGNYSPNVDNWLESPPFDGGQHISVWLRFQRWLSYKGDAARILLNNRMLWSAPTGNLADSTWMEQMLLLTPYTYQVATNRLRFTLISDSANEAGGWNLDDVWVEALSQDLVKLTASTTTPPVMTGFNLEIQTLGGGGYPFALVASGLAAPYRLPNLQDPVWLLPPLVPVIAATTNASGVFKVPLILPRELKGVPIHFQAVAASAASGNILSNLLTVTAR